MLSIPKKIIGLSALLLVAVPMFFSAGFLIRQKLIQSRMEEKIEQEPLQTVTLPLATVKWITKDKEAIIDGKLFDIKYFTVENDKIILKGLYDKEEDNLVTKFNDDVHTKNDNSTPFHHLIAKYLLQPVFNDPISFSIETLWKNISSRFSSPDDILSEAHCFLVIPPPKAS